MIGERLDRTMRNLALLALVTILPMTGPGCSSSMKTASLARAKADASTLAIALDTYEKLGGRYPTSAQGLDALLTRPTTGPLPKAWTQQISSAPTDPWGRPYLYVEPGIHNPSTFDVFSAGPDGVPGTVDDIGNW